MIEYQHPNAPRDRARQFVDGELLPCADDLVTLHQAGEWRRCGQDGAGPCPQRYCYGDGPQCPRADACGCNFVEGMRAALGRFQFTEREND